MTGLFDRARQISAADTARREGLFLHRKGQREWTCCPLHREKTPSLCFYPDGRWYCFGCHESGDAVDLYAALHHVSRVEAARTLTGTDALPRHIRKAPSKRPAYLEEPDEDGFTWDRLCEIRNAADAIIMEESADTDRLWAALAARSAAEERMDNMLLREEARRQSGATSRNEQYASIA